MSIHKDELYRLIDRLDPQDDQAALDFLKFLVQGSKTKANDWESIDQVEPDYDQLSKQELEQLDSEEGYIFGEEATIEFRLQVDLP